MQLSDAITLLKRRMSNYQSTAIDSLIILEMNAQQDILEQEDFKPWFLLTENATTQNTADEERLPIPTDFLEEWEEGCLSWKLTTAANSAYKGLSKDDYDYLVSRYTDPDAIAASTEGTPKGYALAGDYFLIVPTPTVVYDWRMRYYAAQLDNEDDTDENNWLKYAADWLISQTGEVIAAQYLNNAAAAKAFSIQKDYAKARVERAHIAREEANRERMMGE